MSTARLLVRAIVVTDGRSRRLPAVLDALSVQTVQPDMLHVVVTAGAQVPNIPATLRATVHESQASRYTDAIAEVLDAYPALPREYLWLLHDDTAPLPDALAALAAVARKRSKAAVVGAAHVRWDDVNRLVNLGTTVSRVGARRVTLVEEDDVNQGQYAARDDVLAVSMAAALVRRDVWESFEGLDAGYRGFGDSTDFCRRAWYAGHDVVIVPAAKVRHSQDSLYGTREGLSRGRRSTYARRRTSEWYHALVWGPAWVIGLLLAWSFLSAPVRAVGRISQNEPGMIAADLSVPWRLLTRLPMVPVSRASIARTSVVPAAQVRPLLAGLRTIVTHVRARELGAYEQWRAQTAPSDVVKAELAAVAARRWKAFWITVLVATGLSALLFGRWIPGLIGGQMLAGPGLGVTDVTTGQLWTRAWTGWSEQGFGSPALDGAFATMMLPLSALGGDLRLGLGLLLSLSVLWATLAAWAAAGAATRFVWVRASIALAYAVWPMFLQSVNEGRVGPVIAHIALPLVALGVARAVGWQRGEVIGDGDEHPQRRIGSPSAGLGAAVALAVTTTAAPVLLVPLVIAVVTAGVFAGRFRWRVWTIPVPALVIAGPAILAWWAANPLTGAAWRILARDNGPALLSPVASPWQLLVGVVDDGSFPGGFTGLVMAALGVSVLVGAMVSLVTGRAPGATVVGWVVAAMGLGVAAVSQRFIVVFPDGAGGMSANGWPGSGSSLMAVGLLTAIAAASHGAWANSGDRAAMWKRLGAVGAVTTAVVVVAAHVALTAWPGSEPDSAVALTPTSALPLVASLEQEVQTQQRVLVLSEDGNGAVRFAVVSSDGSEVLTGRAHHDADGVPLVRGTDGKVPTQVDSLTGAVASLVSSGVGASDELAAWGIGVIVAAPDSPRVAGALEQIPEIALMGASERGTSFRVARPDSDVPVSHAWITTEDGAVEVLPMPTGAASERVSSTDAGTVVVASTDDESWRATLDGQELERVPDELGRVAFALPATGGILEVAYHDAFHRTWRWLSALALTWALLGAVPLHGQRHREEPTP